MCETFPPLDDVFAKNAGIPLPEHLEELLRERYREHGPDYATATLRDGVPENACMQKNNLVDVEEELVDAVFNALIYNYRAGGGIYAAPRLLSLLLDAWRYSSSLMRQKQ